MSLPSTNFRKTLKAGRTLSANHTRKNRFSSSESAESVEPASAPAPAPASTEPTSVVDSTLNTLSSLVGMTPVKDTPAAIPVSVGGDESSAEPVESAAVEPTEAEEEPVEEPVVEETLSSVGDVASKFASFYGVESGDVVTTKPTEDYATFHESVIEVSDGNIVFKRAVKKGERVAVLYQATVGFEEGIIAYPASKLLKGHTTSNTPPNVNVIITKLELGLKDRKGVYVKTFSLVVVATEDVLAGTKLIIPYLPSFIQSEQDVPVESAVPTPAEEDNEEEDEEEDENEDVTMSENNDAGDADAEEDDLIDLDMTDVSKEGTAVSTEEE